MVAFDEGKMNVSIYFVSSSVWKLFFRKKKIVEHYFSGSCSLTNVQQWLRIVKRQEVYVLVYSNVRIIYCHVQQWNFLKLTCSKCFLLVNLTSVKTTEK